jgi:DNA-binding NarL/FixJ family response regulator
VVLIDLRMPVVDGFAATREIMAAEPDARIIIVTDYDVEQLRAAPVDSGARAYFLKQNLNYLAEVIAQVNDRN